MEGVNLVAFRSVDCQVAQTKPEYLLLALSLYLRKMIFAIYRLFNHISVWSRVVHHHVNSLQCMSFFEIRY